MVKVVLAPLVVSTRSGESLLELTGRHERLKRHFQSTSSTRTHGSFPLCSRLGAIKIQKRLPCPRVGQELNWAVTSMDLAHNLTLRSILGFEPSFHSRLMPRRASVYIRWGRKWSGQRAVAIAAAEGKEFQLLEDGFLRSEARLDASLSLVLDSSGTYYDATSPSQLETLVAQLLSPKEQVRARSIIATWRAES